MSSKDTSKLSSTSLLRRANRRSGFVPEPFSSPRPSKTTAPDTTSVEQRPNMANQAQQNSNRSRRTVPQQTSTTARDQPSKKRSRVSEESSSSLDLDRSYCRDASVEDREFEALTTPPTVHLTSDGAFPMKTTIQATPLQNKPKGIFDDSDPVSPLSARSNSSNIGPETRSPVSESPKPRRDQLQATRIHEEKDGKFTKDRESEEEDQDASDDSQDDQSSLQGANGSDLQPGAGFCVWNLGAHNGSCSCSYSTFDPYISKSYKPDSESIDPQETYTAEMHLDLHGHWNIFVQTMHDRKRGVAWLDPTDDQQVRKLIGALHNIVVRITWSGMEYIEGRGSRFQGRCDWSAYCPLRPPGVTTVCRNVTLDEELANNAHLDRSSNNGIDIPPSSMSDVFKQIELEQRLSEERRAEEKRRNRFPHENRSSSQLN